MSDNIKRQIEQLQKKLGEVWLEESDCSHLNEQKKKQLNGQLQNITSKIKQLKTSFYAKLNEEENEAEHQASFCRNTTKKRKFN